MNNMNEIKICGLQKTTLLDYPGHLAATVFLGGCNFRCPFCHNSGLLGSDAEPLFTAKETLEFLHKRKGILEGVCITGGEPTLQADALEDYLTGIRSLGLLIKLDTNGTRPEVLKRLYKKGLLDFIAMDIKGAPEHYERIAGVPGLSLDGVRESVSWLLSGTLPYEFRTTVVKGLHDHSDFSLIGPWIAGCPQYFLQNYVATDTVLKPDGYCSFSKEELTEFAGLAAPYVGRVSLRGIDLSL